MPTYYVVEQGMRDPGTTNTIGWRYWSVHPTKSEAIKEGRKVTPLARVLAVTVLWERIAVNL